jgi:hypothetical protein
MISRAGPAGRRAMSTKVQVPKVKNLINGKFVDSTTKEWIPLYNPVRGGRGGLRRRTGPNFPRSLT